MIAYWCEGASREGLEDTVKISLVCVFLLYLPPQKVGKKSTTCNHWVKEVTKNNSTQKVTYRK